MKLPLPTATTVSDPLYGSIPLTEVEQKVIDCQAFQRLRRIQQLGLMDLVFPSADYSRFAHSIGACHVLGMILEKLPLPEELKPEEWQELRLAMLLHDVGHYPMSHATEKAAEKYYKNAAVNEANGAVDVDGDDDNGKLIYVSHEPFGRKVLEHDNEIRTALTGYSPERIGGIFARELDSPLKNLVSSEMDADRLDYLMRSSQATGLPYGHYDRDYLLQNLDFDNSEMVCLGPKALRAADHYLMCRAFDYMQTIFHKTVVGLEQMLQHCVIEALNLGVLKLAEADLVGAIKSSEWQTWDDAWLLSKLGELEVHQSSSQMVRSMAKRVRLRKPATCMWMYETLLPKNDATDDRKRIAEFLEKVESIPSLAGRVITWHKEFGPTDVSPSQRTLNPDDQDEDQNKLIRIKERDGSSKPLIENQNSLIRVLGERSYVFGRVYFVGDDRDEATARAAVTAKAVDQNLESACR